MSSEGDRSKPGKPQHHPQESKSRRPVPPKDRKSTGESESTAAEPNTPQSQKKDNTDPIAEVQLNEQKRANRIATTSNRISQKGVFVSTWTLWITAIYMVITGGIFGYSVIATNNSTNSLEETKREFKTLNEPYLEITQPRLGFTDSVSEMTVYYQLENLKAVPAQIIYKAQQCDLDTSNNPNIDSLFNLAESKKDTTYLGNGKNAYLTNDSKWPPFFVRFNPKTSLLTKDGYQVLKSTHMFWIYICDVIHYRDALTNTERVYKGIVRVKNITDNNRFYTEYVYNENGDAPTK